MLCQSFLQEVTSLLLAGIKEKDNVNRSGEVSKVHKVFFLNPLKNDKISSFNRNHRYLKLAGKKPKLYFCKSLLHIMDYPKRIYC